MLPAGLDRKLIHVLRLVAALWGAGLGPALPLSATDFTISDNVDLVVLDVAVKDATGVFVSNLLKGDLQVFEDGHRRDIKDFSTMDAPVTLGLVVDNSGSMAAKRPRVIAAGLAFVKASNPKDQFFVVNFNNTVTRGLPFSLAFSDDLQLLSKALYFGAPTGQTALYDALAYSLKHLRLSREQRRALVVVSDGRDNVSHLDFQDLMQEIESSRTTIYTIGLSDPLENELSPRILRRIARATGGEYFEPKQLSDMTATMEKISQDIRCRYTLSYVPDEVSNKHRLRKVKVIARRNGRKLAVSTRTTYSVGAQ